MKCCRVVAPMWAAVKHPAFAGRPLFVVQPLDELGKDAGTSFVAIDNVQAGINRLLWDLRGPSRPPGPAWRPAGGNDAERLARLPAPPGPLVPAGDYQIVDRQRRTGGAVVLTRVGHLDVPQQLAIASIQRDQVRVVGDHEHASAEYGNAAIDAGGGVAGEALRARPAVVPDLMAALRIERVGFVHRRDVHHPVGDNGRHLERPRRAVDREHPFRREAVNRRSVDLVERAESIAAQIPVIGRPFAASGPCDIGEGQRPIRRQGERVRNDERSRRGQAR